MTADGFKKWTVAIYMVADGRSGSRDLDQVAIREIGDIVRAAGTPEGEYAPVDDINVAIQVDLHGVNGTLRMIVDRNGIVSGMTTAEADVADPGTLASFFEFVTERCRSRRYLVLFWGHSSGPVVLVGDYEVSKGGAAGANGNQPSDAAGAGEVAGVLKRLADATNERCAGLRKTKGDCCRQGALKEKETHEGEAAREAAAQNAEGEPVIDILLFKECFMANVETAFEFGGNVQCMIASQGRVPRLGWPYRKIFERLAKSPDVVPAANGILDELTTWYEYGRNRSGKDEVPFSLIDLATLNSCLAQAIGDLVGYFEQLRATADGRRQFVDAFDRASVGDSALVDLKTLCQRLPDSPAAKQMIQVLDKSVRMNDRPSVFGGVSAFYFPRDPLEALGPALVGGSFIAPVVARHPERYRRLKITTATKWGYLALRQLRGWKSDLLQSFADGGEMVERNFSALESFSKATAMGDVFGREADLVKNIDFTKSIDFAKLVDLTKSVDFTKTVDFVNDPTKTVDFANDPA